MPGATLFDRASEQTRTLLRMAATWPGVRLVEPAIRFDLRGRAAGQARINLNGPGLIRYNPLLLTRHGEAFIIQTVPHEVAHLVTYALYGRKVRPHGPEWQGIMRRLGAVPERCHQFDVSDASARRLRTFEYHCDCQRHDLSSIRHHRVLTGQTYLCRRCATALRAGPTP